MVLANPTLMVTPLITASPATPLLCLSMGIYVVLQPLPIL